MEESMMVDATPGDPEEEAEESQQQPAAPAGMPPPRLPPGPSTPASAPRRQEEGEPPSKAARARMNTCYNLPAVADTEGVTPKDTEIIADARLRDVLERARRVTPKDTEIIPDARLRDVLGRARRFIKPIAELQVDIGERRMAAARPDNQVGDAVDDDNG